MKTQFFSFVILLLAALSLSFNPTYAQCDAYALACLDVEAPGPQTLVVTIWTGDPHCPASGNIDVWADPPDAVLLGTFEPRFENVFSEYYTIRIPVTGSSSMPLGTPIPINVSVIFDDPVYTPLLMIEIVVQTDPTGRLDQYRPGGPCNDYFFPTMTPGQAECFEICHWIYRINLGILPANERPVINISPGCGVPTVCPPRIGCTPGGEHDYRYDVYQEGSDWILEFEYSNQAIEPACYCVSYEIGTVTYGPDLSGLIAVDRAWQTVDLTLWNPAGLATGGFIDLFTYPDGGWISHYIPEFYDASGRYVLEVSAGGGGMMAAGMQFKVIAYVEQGGAPVDYYPPEWFVEDVIVTPEGGLEIIDEGGECTDTSIPEILIEGESACIQVCHDIYHIPLDLSTEGEPIIIVTPGCGFPTPCPELPGCAAGGADDYRYEVYRIGGTWFLEFEYSNPNNEPACYCVEFAGVTFDATQPYLLAALNREHQTLDITLWTSETECNYPASGTITVSKGPYELDPDAWVESFFDVFYRQPAHWEIPVSAGMYLPGQNFQFEIDADFGPGSDPFDGIIYYENAMVTETGELAQWYPAADCEGEPILLELDDGNSLCITVCHEVYYILLGFGNENIKPNIDVAPGCDPPCITVSPPGGKITDCCYETVFIGGFWFFRFEYSNELIQPVCYCISFNGYKLNNIKHELKGVDERDQTLDMTVWMTASADPPPSVPVDITVCRTDQPHSMINAGSYILDTYDEYLTVSIPVDNGGNPPGTAFQYIVHFDYNDLFDDVLISEEVIVALDGTLAINDVGGECVGDNVPLFMDPYVPYCFHVCHKVYHIDLNIPGTRRPLITIMPGCDPPCDDPGCVPGGPYDYRYDFVWMLDHWELEFEYSNENAEPVCYCIIVEPDLMPPVPVNDFVIYYQYAELAVPSLHFYWEAPEAGTYTIYSATEPNIPIDPTDPGWTDLHTAYYDAGDCHWSMPVVWDPADDGYMIFLIQYTP